MLVEEGWPLASLAACEIRPEEREHLEAVAGRVVIGDWLDACVDLNRVQAMIANPPFSQLPDFAEILLDRSGTWWPYAALLLPIEELAGKQSSARFFSRVGAPTDLIPIPWRPWSCVRGVAWFVWRAERRGSTTIHLMWS